MTMARTVLLLIAVLLIVPVLAGCESLDKGVKKVEAIADPITREREYHTDSGHALQIRPEDEKKAKLVF